MHFVYQGFTHEGGVRCFSFRGVEEVNAATYFSLRVDLLLLAQNRIPVQDGPSFCLELLKTASVAGPTYLERFQNYRLVNEDFRPLLVERERRAAEKAQKAPARRVIRKPPITSNLHGLGKQVQEL